MQTWEENPGSSSLAPLLPDLPVPAQVGGGPQHLQDAHSSLVSPCLLALARQTPSSSLPSPHTITSCSLFMWASFPQS